MKIEVWPFLISRNIELEYRTVAAPDFMVNAGIGNLLADAIYGDKTESREAIYCEIHNSKVGELTVLFQVLNPIAKEVGIDGNELLMDRYYRPILFLEGIVTKTKLLNIAIGKKVFTEVRNRLLEPFSRFWYSAEFFQPIALESFEVEIDDGTDEILQITNIKEYIVHPESLDNIKTTEEPSPFTGLEEINQNEQKVRSLQAYVNFSDQKPRIPTNTKWDYTKENCVSSEVSSIAFSSKEDILAARTDNQKVLLWNLSTDNNCTFIAQTTFTSIPGAVTFSPDGKTIASSFIESGSNVIKLWQWNQYANEKDSEIILANKTQDIHPDKYFTTISEAVEVRFSPDGQFIICGSQDKSIQVWDAKTLTKYVDELSDIQSRRVSSFDVSPDSRMIVGGCEDGKIVFWKIKTKAYVNISPFSHAFSHEGRVNAVAFSPDGKSLASAGSDNTIYLWNLSNKKEAQFRVLDKNLQPCNAIAFSPDSRFIAYSSSDCIIHIWDINEKRKIQTLPGHGKSINSLAFNSNGRILASGSKDQRLIIWQLD